MRPLCECNFKFTSPKLFKWIAEELNDRLITISEDSGGDDVCNNSLPREISHSAVGIVKGIKVRTIITGDSNDGTIQTLLKQLVIAQLSIST